MELKSFIAAALVQIAEGIDAANEKLNCSEATVNPRNITVPEGWEKVYGVWNKNALEMHPIVELIEFDVAIQIKEDSEASGKAGLSVAQIGFGAKGSISESRGTESRIKFKIPMVYPRAKQS